MQGLPIRNSQAAPCLARWKEHWGWKVLYNLSQSSEIWTIQLSIYTDKIIHIHPTQHCTYIFPTGESRGCQLKWAIRKPTLAQEGDIFYPTTFLHLHTWHFSKPGVYIFSPRLSMCEKCFPRNKDWLRRKCKCESFGKQMPLSLNWGLSSVSWMRLVVTQVSSR